MVYNVELEKRWRYTGDENLYYRVIDKVSLGSNIFHVSKHKQDAAHAFIKHQQNKTENSEFQEVIDKCFYR